jgi:opacity protein-like surface antigen
VRLLAVFVGLLLTPVSASAQHRGYVHASGGATFMSDVSGVFGAESGFHVRPNLIVFGQAGRMLNVLPRDIQEDIESAAALLGSFTGRPWEFEASIRATYAGGGVRYLLPFGSRIRPYAAGGVGMVHYAGSLSERELGDVLDQAVSLGVVDTDDVKGNEIAIEVGGGVLIPRGRLQFDAGYRLMNVRGVNVSRLVAGAGIRF